MKKFLLSLAVLFAGVATAQTYYSAGESTTEIYEGTQYLLSSDAAGTRVLTNDGKNYLTSDLATDAALVEFEYADSKEEGDATVDLYLIKFSESGLYIADQEMWDGMDSSDMKQDGIDPWDPAPYIFLTDDASLAAKWTILPAAARTKGEYDQANDAYPWDNWRVWTGQGDGSGADAVPFENAMVIMRDALTTAQPGNVEDKKSHNPVYLETQSDFVMFATWGSNSWFISEPEEMDEDALLYHWVDANFPENIDGLLAEGVGNRAGMYSPESVEALKEAFERFNAYDLGESDDDPAEILAALIAGKEALKVNEVEEGYYYLTSKRGSYVAYDNNGGIVGKGGFVIPTEEGTDIPSVTVETSTYLWHFAPVAGKERTFLIKNFGSGKYASTSAHNTPLVTSEEGAEYTFDFLEGRYGTVYIFHKNDAGQEDCAWNIFSGWAGTPVGHWRDRNDEGNFWYLTPVATEKVEAIKDEVAQYELNQRLQNVYDNALAKYNLGRSYKPEAACTADDDFTSHGYLTYEADADGNLLSTNVTVVDANGNPAIHTSDGSGSVIGFLDGNKATFTHTVWGGTTYPHNFDIDLGEGESLEAIALKMMRRTGTSDHNASFGFGEPKIFVRNDTLEAWKMVGTLPMTYNIPLYARDAEGNITTNDAGEKVVEKENFIGLGACGLGGAYRYIRVQHFKTLPWTSSGVQENTYFSASELALFGAAYDEATSLNTVVPAEIISALLAQMDAAKAQLAAGKATEAQITALQKALEEFLKNFPEPSRLVDAVAAAEEIAGNLPMGGDDEVGYYPETAVLAYAEIVDAVKASIKEVMTLDEINNGIAQLDAAKEAVLKTLVMPASGYYQIRVDAANYKDAILHSGRNAADTKEVKGLRADFAKKVMAINGTDTTYVDNENFSKAVSSVWYVKVGQDNKLSIRSLATGLYAQPCLRRGNNIQFTQNEVEIALQADGLKNAEQYNFVVGTDTASGKTLYFNINSTTASQVGDLVSWDSAAGGDNSTFRLEPVSLEDFAYGANYYPVTAGTNQFLTFIYDTPFFAQKAKVYEVAGYYVEGEGETAEKAIYFTPVAVGTTLTAGTPYLIRTEAGTNYFKTQWSKKTIAESDFVYGYEGKDVNGLVGTIFTTEVAPKFGVLGFGGMITSTASTTNAEGEEVLHKVAPLSAYINGNNLPVLDAAPAGDDVVKILTKLDIENLNAIEGVEVVETAKTGIYTLSGVRLNSTQNLPAGIYIINGKKVVK